MKYKRIKAAFHNFADSFASTLNWAHADYVMSHLLRAAIDSRKEAFEVDLSTGGISPTYSLHPEITSVVRARALTFPRHLQAEGLDPTRIRGAIMRIAFRLDALIQLPPPGEYESPFEVTIHAFDDRGQNRTGGVRGRWGTDAFGPRISPLERLWRWFVRQAV
jgi:hypothetical protein